MDKEKNQEDISIKHGAITVKDAAADAAKAFSGAAEMVGIVASEVTGKAGAVAVDAVRDAYVAFGGTTGKQEVGNLRAEDGSLKEPRPILNKKENADLVALTKRYEKMTEPGPLENAGNRVAEAIPQPMKKKMSEAAENLSQQQLYQAAIDVIARGFKELEKRTANASVSFEYVVDAINRGSQRQKVSSLDEICLLRSYDVARVLESQDTSHLALAFAEGAATGAPGFAGIPFNLVLSTFLYYRAVQSVAMFYGYDVKKDPSELVIAGEVFACAMSPGNEGKSGAAGLIGKIMISSETESAARALGKGYVAAANRGGLSLVVTQMRALANNAAATALQKTGRESLESSVFRSVFEQIGMRLTQKTVQRAVPIIGGAIGAVFDTGMMSRILEYADVFYQKRFIIEKADRINALEEGESADVVMHADDIDFRDIPMSSEMAGDDEGLKLIG